MKYGALLNNTFNIGDDLQTVASERFLPQVDYYMFKEQLHSFRSENHEKVKTILNSWYMWRPDHFPPSEDIDPLCISMHFAEQCRGKILSAKTRAWMLEHGPIGCRDMDTQNWLEANGIPAYFSGCLTLTLEENQKLKRQKSMGNYILCVNVADPVVAAVKSRTDKPVFVMEKNLMSSFYAKDRIEISKMYLYLYHQADAVVTGNMHASLPCLAMKTPVCLLTDENKGPDVQKRFSGLLENFHHFTTEEFMARPVYDFDAPPCNYDYYEELKENLIQKCAAFTGFQNEKPTLPDDFNPTMELMKLLQFCQWREDKAIKEMICHPGNISLLKYYVYRFFGKDKHDLIQY